MISHTFRLNLTSENIRYLRIINSFHRGEMIDRIDGNYGLSCHDIVTGYEKKKEKNANREMKNPLSVDSK